MFRGSGCASSRSFLYWSHGHGCDRVTVCAGTRSKRGKNVGSQGKGLRVTGREPLSLHRLPIPKRSVAYTQTIVRLYPNDCAPIRKLKR